MINKKYIFILLIFSLLSSFSIFGNNISDPILVLSEGTGQHKPFSDRAIKWLEEEGFNITVLNNTEKIDSAYLAQYKVFLQLDYPPYNWTEDAQVAFENALFGGTIGWVGFHHAALLGNFDGYPIWNWFSEFLGGIRFKSYISELTDGTINVENTNHPIMKGVNKTFTLSKEEWYTFDKSPRGDGFEVLANVDENSYYPPSNIKMGDHPVVWSNNRMKARNVYFLFGHHPELFDSDDFTKMFKNAINWAAGTPKWFPRFRVLMYVNPNVEEAHRQFADDTIKFFQEMTIGDGIDVDVIYSSSDITYERLRSYHLFVCPNDNPGHLPCERAAFQKYMDNGGSWLGIHAAGYNDSTTGWQWYVDFLGGGVFFRNNWTPQPAKLVIDDNSHPVTKALPDSYISPTNEWYQWKPSPRENSKIKVLLSLSPENYPLGFKDIVPDGDLPVVWTNTDYNMLYMNMGHGDEIYSDATQKLLFFNAVRWLMRSYLPQ